MNRIKQLAEQAETWNADGDKCEVDLEKFAELIVRHCIYKFGQTRTEPSLEKYIMDGLKNES